MASPVAHGFFAATLFYLTGKKGGRGTLLLFIVLACMPDADLVIGYLFGDLGALHRQASHSLWGLAIISLIASVIYFIFEKHWKKACIMFIWVTILLWSHCLIDYLTYDLSDPKGIMIFWPWDLHYYMASYTPFKGFFWGEHLGDYINKKNLLVVLWDFAVSFPPFLLVWWLSSRYRSSTTIDGASQKHYQDKRFLK
ncbi:MAG: metal-dependent hydrolase [Chlamydiota bacterium]|nr:metal-dependent hydrolase [Chlamydiota bacterium]